MTTNRHTFTSIGIVGLVGLMLTPAGICAQQQDPDLLDSNPSPARAARRGKTAEAMQALRRSAPGNWRIYQDTLVGTPIWMDYRTGVAALPVSLTAGSPEGAVRVFLAKHGTIWGGPELGATLRKYKETVDRRGAVHIFYEQFYRGVRVQGAELVFVAVPSGRNRYAVGAVYGRYHPDIHVTVSANITRDAAARAIALDAGGDLVRTASADRVIVLAERGYRLAWSLHVRTSAGSWHGIVDAKDGTVYLRVRTATKRIGGSPDSLSGGRNVLDHSRNPLKSLPMRKASEIAPTLIATCNGTDAFGSNQNFGCHSSSGVFKLVDATNSNAHQIRVYGLTCGYDVLCPENLSSSMLSKTTDGIWNAPNRGDEVSAVYTANLVLDDYAAYYSIQHFSNNPSTNLHVIASSVSLFDAVYLSNSDHLLFFEGGSAHPSLHWTGLTRTWLATAASKDAFGHEFQHGVNEYSQAATGNSVVSVAIDEALADILSLHLTEDPCLDNAIIVSPDPIPLAGGSPDSTTVYPGCTRNLIPDVHRLSGWARHAISADHAHEYSLIVSSALYDARPMSSAGGERMFFDVGIMYAVRVWLRQSPTLLETREAIVHALKITQRRGAFDNAAVHYGYLTEFQFHQNRVGPEAFRITELTWNTEGEYWEATAEGTPGTNFNAMMASGDHINDDGSVCDPLVTQVGCVPIEHASNWQSVTIPPSGVVHFIPGQHDFLPWHYPEDGHKHAVKAQVATQSNCCGGYLLYFRNADGIVPVIIGPPLPAVVAGNTNGRTVPNEWVFSQSLRKASSAPSGLISADVMLTGLPTTSPGYNLARDGITSFALAVPADVRAARVRIRIYDMTGRLVRTAVNEALDPGKYAYHWNGKDDHGRKLAPGVYLAVIEAPGFKDMIKLVLTR